MTLPGAPTLPQLPRWKAQALSNFLQCANRRKEKPVREFFLAVEQKGATLMSLRKTPREFKTVDRKLGTAMGKLVTGELARRIDVYEQRELRGKRRLLSGRQKLFLFYESYRTDENMARCYTIKDLMALTFPGDDKLEQLRNDWEDRIANCAEEQPPAQQATILYDILKHSTKLREDMGKYRRYEKGHKKNNIGFLLKALDRQILLDQHDRSAKTLQGKSPAAPVKRKGLCKKYLEGKCCGDDNPNCKKNHPPGRYNEKNTSPAAPATANGQHQGGPTESGAVRGRPGKGEGKGKGNRDPSTGSEGGGYKKLPCKFFQVGKCGKTQAECPWPHRQGTPEELAKMQEIEEKRKAKGKGKHDDDAKGKGKGAPGKGDGK